MTFISVIAATESHDETVAVEAVAISASGISGNTTWKQLVSRRRVSSMSFCSPQFAHLMIQRRALRLELLARQAKLRLWLLAEQGREELAQRAVLRGRREVQFHLARARRVEQHLQRLMLDAAREGAAAHHPCLNG